MGDPAQSLRGVGDAAISEIASAGPRNDRESAGFDLLLEFRRLLEHHYIPAKGYLNLTQAALYLGTSPGTVREWIRTRRLPNYKPGKELLFKRPELDAWMERHRTVNGPFPKEVTHV